MVIHGYNVYPEQAKVCRDGTRLSVISTVTEFSFIATADTMNIRLILPRVMHAQSERACSYVRICALHP